MSGVKGKVAMNTIGLKSSAAGRACSTSAWITASMQAACSASGPK